MHLRTFEPYGSGEYTDGVGRTLAMVFSCAQSHRSIHAGPPGMAPAHVSRCRRYANRHESPSRVQRSV